MKKILVVDDESDLVETIKKGLEHYGFSVVGYTDPQKMLSEYRCGAYDFLLMDVNMPVMDGFKLCREILKKDRAAKIRFMSASDASYGAFRLGFPEMSRDDFIKKPFGLSDLANKLVPGLIT